MDDTWLQKSYIYIGKVKPKLETNTSYMVGYCSWRMGRFKMCYMPANVSGMICPLSPSSHSSFPSHWVCSRWGWRGELRPPPGPPWPDRLNDISYQKNWLKRGRFPYHGALIFIIFFSQNSSILNRTHYLNTIMAYLLQYISIYWSCQMIQRVLQGERTSSAQYVISMNGINTRSGAALTICYQYYVSGG